MVLFAKLSNRSAFTNSKIKISEATNFYKDHFKQGATIVPRNFYFVESEQLGIYLSESKKPDLQNRTFHFQTNEALLKVAKLPWKDFKLGGRVNSNFLFLTALSKNIVPFGLLDTLYVLLNSIKKQRPKSKKI